MIQLDVVQCIGGPMDGLTFTHDRANPFRIFTDFNLSLAYAYEYRLKGLVYRRARVLPSRQRLTQFDYHRPATCVGGPFHGLQTLHCETDGDHVLMDDLATVHLYDFSLTRGELDHYLSLPASRFEGLPQG